MSCGVNCFKRFSLRSVQGQVVKYTLLSREIHFRLTCIRDSVDVTTRSVLFYRIDRLKHDVSNLTRTIFRVDVMSVNSDYTKL